MKTADAPNRPGTVALRLRALAHPLRWQLLDVVASEGSATATRCAELTGESVASCAYHLGILAKYGYLEPVPGVRGREKPWRPTTQLTADLAAADADAASRSDAEAGTAAAIAFLQSQTDLIRTRLLRESQEPPEWRDTSLMAAALVYVTPPELRQIKEELGALLQKLDKFSERAADPAKRPAGSRPARLFLTSYPDPPPPGTKGPVQ